MTDVALLDLPQRPTMHGIELMRRLVVVQPDLKVILFSGQPKDTIEKLGGLAPGTTFVAKPFTVERLVRAIEEVLGS